MQTIKAISYGYHQESNQPSAGEYRLQFSRIIGCKSFTVKADPTTFEVREVIKSEKGIEEVVFANNGKRDNRSRDDEKRLMGLVRVPYPNSNNSSEEKKLGILEANALYLEGVREMNFFIKEVNLKEDFKTDVEAIITTLDDAVMA